MVLDDVNLTSSAVGECGDLFCALVQAHCSGMVEEGFIKDDGVVGGHGKAFISALLSSALHPCSKMADPLFIE
jgi:hypothetical protein